MTTPVAELLAQLVEATPLPPGGNDPELVLTAFDAMIASRAALLHALERATPVAVTAAGRALATELDQRDRAWISALGLARSAVADRLAAVRRAQRRA